MCHALQGTALTIRYYRQDWYCLRVDQPTKYEYTHRSDMRHAFRNPPFLCVFYFAPCISLFIHLVSVKCQINDGDLNIC